MKNKDCRGRFVFVFVVFCFSCLSPAIAGVPDMEGLMRDLFKEQIAQEQPDTSEFVSEMIGNFDLGRETDEVMGRITTEPEFKEYIESREATLSADRRAALKREDQFAWLLDYVDAQEDVKPEIKAWLHIFVPHEQSLGEMIESYREFEKFRPNDFAPKFFTLFQAQIAEKDFLKSDKNQEFMDILLGAITVAGTPKQKGFISFFAAGLSLQISDENSESANRIWESVRDLEIPETSDQESKGSLTLGKLFAAMAAKEWVAASEIARENNMRAFEPVLLVFAGKEEEAYERNQALRSDSTLTGKERSAFEAFEPFVLMGAQKFDELRMVILEKRRSPTLTIKERDWLDMIERLNNQTDELARP